MAAANRTPSDYVPDDVQLAILSAIAYWEFGEDRGPLTLGGIPITLDFSGGVPEFLLQAQFRKSLDNWNGVRNYLYKAGMIEVWDLPLPVEAYSGTWALSDGRITTICITTSEEGYANIEWDGIGRCEHAQHLKAFCLTLKATKHLDDRLVGKNNNALTRDDPELRQIPALNRSDGSWVKSKVAARQEKVDVDTLRRYRREGRINEDKLSGIDQYGRKWRRERLKSHPWYLQSSLLEPAPANGQPE